MSRRLFLRWAIVHVAACSLLTTLGLAGYADGLTGAPLVVTILILAVALAGSLYAGRLSWLAEQPPLRDRILHDGQHVFYLVAALQILGLVGAMLGYRAETESAAIPDAALAIRHLTLGLGNGLTATLTGVICSLVLWLEHHQLAHRLERGSVS